MIISDAYIAGFFDGEGCISAQSQKIKGKYELFPRVSIQVTITQKHRMVLDLIREQYGGVISLKDKQHPCFQLRIVGKHEMKKFLLAIYPHSIEKKDQIELALRFIETIREENLGCTTLPNDIHYDRREIFNGLRACKGHNVS
jgi:hypothetical protein